MRYVLALFICLLTVCNFAYEINGRLEVLEGSPVWVEGETRLAKLTIWPIEEVDDEYIRTFFDGKDFVDNFFVSKVVSNSFSANNPSAYEVKFNLTLKNHFNQNRPLLLTYKGLVIPVTIYGDVKIEKDPKKISNYVVLDNNKVAIGSQSKLHTYITIGILLLLIILLPIVFKFYKRQQGKKRREEKVLNWKNLIKMANDREDIEYLYTKKEEWIPLLGGENPQFNQLLNTINQHQYKRTWGEDEKNEIDFILSEIKESLDV